MILFGIDWCGYFLAGIMLGTLCIVTIRARRFRVAMNVRLGQLRASLDEALRFIEELRRAK